MGASRVACSLRSPLASLLDPVLERVADELLLPVEPKLAEDVAHVVLDASPSMSGRSTARSTKHRRGAAAG
jgi:hypothetical protein